ncbi:hypothetical protein LZ30DRAFT_83049 [Colletotrichum cereale]|nr:hypothetical protein LZ30DRAFT_83049 [Colletotrichum cereale]
MHGRMNNMAESNPGHWLPDHRDCICNCNKCAGNGHTHDIKGNQWDGNGHSHYMQDYQWSQHASLSGAMRDLLRSQDDAYEKRAALDDFTRDSEQLTAKINRELEHINSLRALVENAHDRCMRATREYNARWGNTDPGQIRADYAKSSKSMMACRARFQTASARVLAKNWHPGDPMMSHVKQEPAPEGPGDGDGEDWPEQSEDEENGVGRVQGWLSGTLDSDSVDDDTFVSELIDDNSTVTTSIDDDPSVTDVSEGSSTGPSTPSRGKGRPGDRGDIESPTLNRRNQPAPEAMPVQYAQAPTKRQRRRWRSRGYRHKPYHR